jgi:hypothetical protein
MKHKTKAAAANLAALTTPLIRGASPAILRGTVFMHTVKSEGLGADKHILRNPELGNPPVSRKCSQRSARILLFDASHIPTRQRQL